MAKKLAVGGLLLILFFFDAHAAAQSERRLNAMPSAFRVFYEKFRTAVVNKDKATVANLTSFPFKYAFDAGDEGKLTKSRFVAQYRAIFSGSPGIFKQRNPLFYVESGSIDLTDPDDASHYIFKKRGAAYVFASYLSEP